jgi:hypothetical protein
MVETQLREVSASFKSPSLLRSMERFGAARRRDVLDLGPPRQGCVDFFGQRNCRLFIEDLDLEALRLQLENETCTDSNLFTDILGIGRPAQLDLILAWDLFNFLTPPAIAKLVNRFEPFCTENTLLYILTYNRETMPAVPGSFWIQEKGVVNCLLSESETLSNPRRSPRELERMMPGFQMAHSFLLQNGLQEYLYQPG